MSETSINQPLTHPINSSTKRIFVAGTRMNDGKTTTCLGLFAALRTRREKVGYIKPIGQRFVEVEGNKIDEDSFLLGNTFNVRVPMQAMSPVAIDSTFTQRYLKNPDSTLGVLTDKLCHAFDRTAREKDLVIIEGSGHAGVGSVFDLSNAQVAKIFGAKAIIVAQGGIGFPIDEIAMNKALFDKFGVEVIGAILNKVIPEKMDFIREYAGIGLKRLGVPLLGILPIEKRLTAPNLGQIVKEIKGNWLNGREHGKNERILTPIIGAMTARSVIDFLQPGVLVITPGDRDDIILSAIAMSGLSDQKAISGIVLTRDILPHPKLMEMIRRTDIPTVSCKEDSYFVASRINKMTVKTQPQDVDKIPIIKRLITENIDIQKIIDSFSPGL